MTTGIAAALCVFASCGGLDWTRKRLGFPIRLQTPDKSLVYLADIAISRDGSTLAATGINGSEHLQPVTLWNAHTLNTSAYWTHPSSSSTTDWVLASALSLSPDGKTVCFSRHGEPFGAYDAVTQNCKWSYNSSSPFSLSRFSDDGRLVALAQYSGQEQATYTVLDSATGKEKCHWTAQLYEFQAAFALAPDGRTLACVAAQRSGKGDTFPNESGRDIEIRRTNDGKRLQTIACPWTSSLSFSPDGKQVVVVADSMHPAADIQRGEQVKCFRIDTGQILWKFGAPKGEFWRQAIFSPDGKTVAAYWASWPAIALLDAQTGTLRRTLRTIDGVFNSDSSSLAFSADGKRLFARGKNAVLLWDLD